MYKTAMHGKYIDIAACYSQANTGCCTRTAALPSAAFSAACSLLLPSFSVSDSFPVACCCLAHASKSANSCACADNMTPACWTHYRIAVCSYLCFIFLHVQQNMRFQLCCLAEAQCLAPVLTTGAAPCPTRRRWSGVQAAAPGGDDSTPSHSQRPIATRAHPHCLTFWLPARCCYQHMPADG